MAGRLKIQSQKLKDDSQFSYLTSQCGLWSFVVLPLHISYRVYLSNRMPIMDCDETFNYWEVVHFILFQDGKAFQTWEYANEFALRTYAYLTPVAGIASVYLQALHSGIFPRFIWPILTEQVFDPSESSKVALFVLLRSTLGAFMACAEVSFCCSIVEQGFTFKEGKRRENLTEDRETKIDNRERCWFTCVGWVTEVLLISSAGMAHSAAALLPSSTLMGLWLLAATAYLRKQHLRFCVLAILATLAIGWPFGVVVLIPMGIGVLFREKERILSFVFFRVLPITVVIQCSVMLVDYQHYGRVVSPLWNIILYNTQAGGDELYGVEPFSYYVKNLMLNLNYVVLVGLAGILPLITSKFGSGSPYVIWQEGFALMAPLYLWLAIVVPRPHKEERFLYPIYPSLCLGAAIVSVSITQWILNHLCWTEPLQRQQKKHLNRHASLSGIILAIIWAPACVISLSRTFALSKYYSAPLHVYAQVTAAIAGTNSFLQLEGTNSSLPLTQVLCTCGEWYRFPSSFFIESESSKSSVIFGFAPSTFTGQLPQYFQKEGSGKTPIGTSGNRFNNKNEPEAGSYVSLERCDFLIELSTSLHSCIEQSEGDTKALQWRPIVQAPFLDGENTVSRLHRILYVPYIHEYAIRTGGVSYNEFVLYTKR